MRERFLVPTCLPRRLHLSAYLNLTQDSRGLVGYSTNSAELDAVNYRKAFK